MRPNFPFKKSNDIESMIRVNQAGEYGAVRIYKGQLAFTKDPETRKELEHMLAQEQEHLDAFNQQLRQRRVRPTLLNPLWHVGGYLMGAATAALGTRSAMACTVAVESVIDKHYQEQEHALESNEAEQDLKNLVTKCREEEMEHHDHAMEREAEKAPGYPIIRGLITGITKTAIELSKRI